jgi:hypothetical protein
MEDNPNTYIVLMLWLMPTIRKDIIKEIRTYFPSSSLLLAAFDTSLFLYNLISTRVTVLPRPQAIPAGALLLLLSHRLAAVFSTAEVTNRVLTVSLGSGDIGQLPMMLKGRKRPAVVQSAGIIYLFGGWNDTYLPDCEQLSLLENQWTPLPQLTPRCSSLSPVKYRAEIYLQRRYMFNCMEVFNIHSLTFRVLKVYTREFESRWLPVSFTYSAELIVMNESESCLRGNIENDSAISMEAGERIKNAGQFQFACLPVLVNTQAVWLDTQGVLQIFDIPNQVITEKSFKLK